MTKSSDLVTMGRGKNPPNGGTGRSTMRDQARVVFSFPNPVNEYAARLVAGMVATLSLVIVIFDVPWLLFFLAYGFAARVLTGPTLSPFGLLATRVLIPLAGEPQKSVAGPPKRFAQSVGAGVFHEFTFDLLRCGICDRGLLSPRSLDTLRAARIGRRILRGLLRFRLFDEMGNCAPALLRRLRKVRIQSGLDFSG